MALIFNIVVNICKLIESLFLPRVAEFLSIKEDNKKVYLLQEK